MEDGADVRNYFGCRDGGEKFGFSAAEYSGGLCFRTVNNSTTSKSKSISCCGTKFSKIVGICSVDEASKFGWIDGRKILEEIRKRRRRR